MLPAFLFKMFGGLNLSTWAGASWNWTRFNMNRKLNGRIFFVSSTTFRHQYLSIKQISYPPFLLLIVLSRGCVYQRDFNYIYTVSICVHLTVSIVYNSSGHFTPVALVILSAVCYLTSCVNLFSFLWLASLSICYICSFSIIVIISFFSQLICVL